MRRPRAYAIVAAVHDGLERADLMECVLNVAVSGG